MTKKATNKRSVRFICALLGASVFTMGMGLSSTALASEPFIAEVKMFAGNFAPRGYAFCDGSLLPISQYSALFSLLGTTYGGDGRTTFALPDLRGRTAIHPGTGPGLSTYRLGQKGGAEQVTLTVNQMPIHNHSVSATLRGTNTAGDSAVPGGNTLASKSRTDIYQTGAPDVDMQADSVAVSQANAGGSQAHENRMPYLAINHIIALQGIFPSRN